MPSDDAKIFSLLFGIGRHMRDGKEKFSLLHFHTLRYVQEQGRPLIRDVARHLCVTPPAATLLVEGLVKDGFVRRAFDRKDRRAVRLALTQAGRSFLSRGIRARMKKLAQLFATLTPRERAAFVAILKKIADAARASER